MTDFTIQPLRVDALDGFHRVLVDAARLPFGYSVCFAADVRWLFLHRWRAALLDAGFPVLHVSAVFRNRMGGPDRQMLWCKLTDELKLDKPTMEERWKEFFIKTNG